MAFDFLEQRLVERRNQSLYRQRANLASAQDVEVEVDGRRYLGFCANDYLGLANHPEVKEAFSRAAKTMGVGSGASHLVLGHHEQHEALECELAQATGRDRALVFSTGYMANVGTIGALLSRSDHVFEDRLNHASLLDGGLASGARFSRYLHNDLDSLHSKLRKVDTGEKLIVTDGVFSMDGDLAPLKALAALAAEHDAWLMVDDAHGFGVLGEMGMGSAEYFGLTQDALPVLMGTFGKALGTFGAFVAGSETLIDYLTNTARTNIYTTAIPPAIAAATRVSLRIVQEESWRRQRLTALVHQFRTEVAAAGFCLMDSLSPIQPIIIGPADQALAWSQFLKERGLLVTAIRAPTVPEGTARLRITFSANHTSANVEQLIEGLLAARHAFPVERVAND